MDITDFIKKHELPDGYAISAQRWFFPVFEQIVSFRKRSDHPVVIGINGSQGSGKSTLAGLFADVLKQAHDFETVVLSIDDFYLTHDERKILSETIHPLLQTRGVPGTHDVAMAIDTLSSLRNFSSQVTIPRFDKSKDDRVTESHCDVIDRRPDIIVLEGWCVGAVAQSASELVKPINHIESEQDKDATWRNYVNEQLKFRYPELFSQIDIWVMLKAPSFDCVYDWRLEQENKLRQSMERQGEASQSLMTDDDISLFIQHYQRITENTLKTLPEATHYLYELDEHREVVRLTNPLALSL